MVNELRYLELSNQLKDLIETFKFQFKSIGHIYAFEPMLYELVQLTMTHLQVDGKFNDEKIDFAIDFYSKFTGKMDTVRSRLHIEPCPYEIGYFVPVSYKTAIKVDNLYGGCIISSKYYWFFDKFMEYINNRFEDVSDSNMFVGNAFITMLYNYAENNLNNFENFSVINK